VSGKTDFKTVETGSDELEQIELKVHKHRMRIIRYAVGGCVILALILVGVWLWTSLRTFTGYEVQSTSEQKDNSADKYASFLDNLIIYNNDGIVCRESEDELVWNQSFEMSTPIISICEGYLAVYDRGGTLIYIMDKDGPVRKIETSMSINRVCIANQGTIAVLMKEDDSSYVQIYDRKGSELASGRFYEENGSFPVDIALSADANKLAIDMIDVTDGNVTSSISFYNFGSVGQNEIDNNVGTYSYEDVFISEIAYVSADRMIAIGDNGFYVFEGSQKPSLKKEVGFEDEVQSVFRNNKYIGITYSNPEEEGSWHIKVYDMSGNVVMENDTDIAYEQVEFLDSNEICVRDAYSCDLFTIHSICKFSYTFEKSLYKILSGTDTQSYTIILDGEIKEVSLQ
jgi:hypothetical protein